MYLSMFVSGYRYLGDGDTDRHEILHGGTYQSRTHLEVVPLRDPKFSPFNLQIEVY